MFDPNTFSKLFSIRLIARGRPDIAWHCPIFIFVFVFSPKQLFYLMAKEMFDWKI